MRILLCIILGISFFCCQPKTTSKGSMSKQSEKITFDLSKLDENGLAGPATGKVAVDYEFCIPAGDSKKEKVKAIDPSLQFFPKGKGRIRCDRGTVLCIGNTHQKDWKNILEKLASQDYIDKIDQVFWE